MLYDPMPVGAVGHVCDIDRFATGHGFTFTFAYADEMADVPGQAIINANRRMH